MPVEFSDSDKQLLAWETKSFAYLALTQSDGTPQVSPIWFEWDGTHIIFNTARGRVKDKIMQKHPVVSMTITGSNPYSYLLIRGRVVAETEEGAWEKICDLQEKYHGNRNFRKIPGQVRVTYKVLPEKVFSETQKERS